MTTVYISIGSNIEREYHIRAAVTELKTLGTGIEVSRIFEAEPVGFSGPNFYNCVLAMETALPLEHLQQNLKQLELSYGRAPDAQKNQSRTLDLDILLYGDLVQDCAPQLPRSDLYKFAFVLLPMMELCPELEIPSDGRTVSQLWHAFEDNQALWPVERIAS